MTAIPMDLSNRTSLIDLLGKLPWQNLLKKGWDVFQTLPRNFAARGMYEVMDYESTLELITPDGREAKFYKRERVRYLQDHIIAYQDQAWGNGKILLKYRCAPGYPVDRYNLGHKQLILISLREVKQRGDIDEFNIQWEIRDGFRRPQEAWETEISHPTRHIRLRVIYPSKRPPQRRVCIEASRQILHPITGGFQQLLPDGRFQVVFEMRQPRLNEHYILKWDW